MMGVLHPTLEAEKTKTKDESDTSRDEVITYQLFVELNREALRIPGDEATLIINDSKDE
jgi:hypothetical protein